MQEVTTTTVEFPSTESTCERRSKVAAPGRLKRTAPGMWFQYCNGVGGPRDPLKGSRADAELQPHFALVVALTI